MFLWHIALHEEKISDSLKLITNIPEPLTEMKTRNLPRGKGPLAQKANNLTAICEPSRRYESLDFSQSYGPPRPATGIALHFPLFLRKHCNWYLKNNISFRILKPHNNIHNKTIFYKLFNTYLAFIIFF
jgi:hypothetical protein